ERWFDFPLDQRPWGAAPSEQAAVDIFDGVVRQNRETFEVLRGPLTDRFGFPVEPEIVYVPGNHDRLCNVYPSLRRRAREALGLAAHDGPFDHAYLDLDHAVYARHGQEWDSFNFEGSEAFSYRTFETVPLEDYVEIPIGDLMSSEVASRL